METCTCDLDVLYNFSTPQSNMMVEGSFSFIMYKVEYEHVSPIRTLTVLDVHYTPLQSGTV